MTGQDAVNVAKSFNDALALDGVVLTKLDGDARGGAALSIWTVTGKPIKFVGTGEKIDALEPFHPERIASRILGMGDILSLIARKPRRSSVSCVKKVLRWRISKSNCNKSARWAHSIKSCRCCQGRGA
jgi:signal recognition particle subunit SRP54